MSYRSMTFKEAMDEYEFKRRRAQPDLTVDYIRQSWEDQEKAFKTYVRRVA